MQKVARYQGNAINTYMYLIHGSLRDDSRGIYRTRTLTNKLVGNLLMSLCARQSVNSLLLRIEEELASTAAS